MSVVRVLSTVDADRELHKLAVAGFDRRAALTHLRKRGLLVPVIGAEDPPAGDPPAGDPPKTDPPKTDPPPADDARVPKTRLDAEAQKRKDAEAERDTLKQQLEAKNDADLSAIQKAEKDRDKQTTRADAAERRLRDALVRSHAVEAGALDADAIVALAATDATIKLDDDGASAKAAVERIKGEKAPLFGEVRPAGGVGMAGGGSSSAPGATPPGGDDDDPKMGMGKDLLSALTGGGRG